LRFEIRVKVVDAEAEALQGKLEILRDGLSSSGRCHGLADIGCESKEI
jgi:hypothetical protein